jgi:hypothetical protein
MQDARSQWVHLASAGCPGISRVGLDEIFKTPSSPWLFMLGLFTADRGN